MRDPLTAILASCLEALEQGKCTVDECLERYPEQRESLAILLGTAVAVWGGAGYTPRPGFREASRARLLKRLVPHQPERSRQAIQHARLRARSIAFKRLAVLGVIILVMGIALIGGGTVHASAAALPGDSLYPVKLSVEDALLFLSDDANDVSLMIEFLQKRTDEIQSLIRAGREDDLPLVAALFSERVSAATEALAALTQEDAERATQLAIVLDRALSSHTEILTSLMETLPDEAKPALEHAILASGRGHEVIHGLFENGLPGGPPLDAIPGPGAIPPAGGPPHGVPNPAVTPSKPGGPPENVPGGPPDHVPGGWP